MCGIFGMLHVGWRDDGDAAIASIYSRGPDEQKLVEVDAGVHLGIVRLAVIDLQGGMQPITTANGRYTIVYNGEVYNYAMLRDELVKLGCTFSTQSDTEVVLQGYARWGAGVLDRLDGMFAFVIWDREKREIFCARDRVGIKPFFYAAGAVAEGGFVFGSTLAPFMMLRKLRRPLDFEAVRDFLAFQTPLAPHSFIASVRELPPGHSLVWKQGLEPRIERYWTIPRREQVAMPREELIEAVDAAIRESVRRQLVSDVPIGAFLSGGIDSSLVVHYMAEAGARPLRTFTVRFDDENADESGFARMVAERYSTEHHEFAAEDVSGATWLDLIGRLDQPLADPAYIPLAALSRLTRQSVTVALSGDGGDELFGGYERFLDIEDNHPGRAWKTLLGQAIRLGISPAALTRRSLAGRAMIDYRKTELGNYPGTRKDFAAYVRPDAVAEMRPERTLGLWHDLIDEFGGKANTDTLMRADLWTYLSENCLRKSDRASMAFALEARVPLLGNPVLDLVLPQPASVHFDPQGKAILRALARRHLPEEVWNRKKHGFSVPLRRFFNGGWREVGDDLVSRSADLAPWLRSDAVTKLWGDARQGGGSRRLAYTLLVLLGWLDRQKGRITV